MSATTRSGPIRSEVARRAILDAAAVLLAERGYDHLTVEGIAARAGVGKQTIYRWWDSKGAVIAECLLTGRLFGDRLALPDSGDIRRDLEQWLEAIFAVVGDDGGDGILRSVIAAAAENAEVGRRLREVLATSDSLLGRLERAVGTTPGLRAGAPLAEIGEALIGAVIVRALSREALSEGDASRIVRAVVG